MPSPDALLKMIRQAAKATPNKGRDDQINAKLSPGEYVIDASTVAAIGDGDNEAGARVLAKAIEQIKAASRPKKSKVEGGKANGGRVEPGAIGFAEGGKVKDVGFLRKLQEALDLATYRGKRKLDHDTTDFGQHRYLYDRSQKGNTGFTNKDVDSKMLDVGIYNAIQGNEERDFDDVIAEALTILRNNSTNPKTKPQRGPNTGGRGYKDGGRVTRSKGMEGVLRTLGMVR